MQAAGTSGDAYDGSLDDLPVELVAAVFSWLPCLDRRIGVARVCRRWRAIERDCTSIRSCAVASGSPRSESGGMLRLACDAAAAGHRRCLERILEGRTGPLPDPYSTLVVAAATQGDVANLVYVESKGYAAVGRCLSQAAAHNRVAAVDHLLASRSVRFFDAGLAVLHATKRGHIEPIAGLAPHCNRAFSYPCNAAAKDGRLDILQILVKNGLPCDIATYQRAAAGGHLDVLRYLHEIGYVWDEGVCAAAAKCARVDALVYLHENGCPWDEATCAAAALDGNMAALVYAHENGCPWDETTCTNAAVRGDIDILQYALSRQCPVNRVAAEREAWTHGHAACVAVLQALPA